ncbi:MAG TPA: hypothetical protein VH085_05100 [Nocardioides sp.]|jgi:hypothetical protein|nr:hypothetical protein [Nocardioides sp.]
MSHSWLRRTTAGAGVGLLLTAVGALTGVGSVSADAADFSMTQGRVTVQLTPMENDMAADGRDGAGLICTFDVLPIGGSFVPMTLDNCIHALGSCASAARDSLQVALVTFYPDRETCRKV